MAGLIKSGLFSYTKGSLLFCRQRLLLVPLRTAVSFKTANNLRVGSMVRRYVKLHGEYTILYRNDFRFSNEGRPRCILHNLSCARDASRISQRWSKSFYL